MTKRAYVTLITCCRIIARMGKRLPPGGVFWCEEKQPLLPRLERRMEAAALAGDAQTCRRFALAWYREWKAMLVKDIPRGEAFVLLTGQERLMRKSL